MSGTLVLMAHTSEQPTKGRWGQPTRAAVLPPDAIHLEPVSRLQVELLGLGVMVEVLARMTADERRRSLAYLNDRYGAPRGSETARPRNMAFTHMTDKGNVDRRGGRGGPLCGILPPDHYGPCIPATDEGAGQR